MDEFHLADREPVAQAIEAANRANTLEELYAEIKAYKGHDLAISEPYSASQPTRHPNPIMIVTEKPEPEDQATGKPFSGAYGKVMRESLDKLGISPEDCHIAYAIHWFPGEEKSPNNTQIAASRPFLFKEIELVRPRVLLAQGKAVINALTNYRGQITPLLGHTLQYKRGEQSLQAYVTWHPAFPLRFTNKTPEFVDHLDEFFKINGSAHEGTLPGPPIRREAANHNGIRGIFKAA